jgi:hypothetical protein
MSGPYDTPCHDYTPTDPLSAGDNLKTFDTQAGKRSSSFLETGAKSSNSGINNGLDAENNGNDCPVDDSLAHVNLDMVNNLGLVNPEGSSTYDPYWTPSYNQISVPFSLANLDPALHPPTPYSIAPTVSDHTSINFGQEHTSFSGSDYQPDRY